ncbi:XP_014780118.1PREDICTED: uncharacterized protein LOC106876191 [Octopus vulgaris]|uniref:XP_014780118.1PREDICTED: uncharacterized protein LOC106876191 n=1 Tax=Octopus vulgaris TaxID=6645 RepID=A0AA36B0J0_OCTVU|nr:XP_014780118.1PREDICTED: uncharacterized protein LOC106876191 [Octopus vulgaris]
MRDIIETSSSKEKPSEEASIKRIGEINNKCLHSSEIGDCSFYSCIEQRFPCGRKGYTIRFGSYYCPRVKSFFREFNAEGRVWINNTIRCHIAGMRAIYEAEKASCNQIVSKAFQLQEQCFINNGFCKVGWENRGTLLKIFNAGDMSPTASLSKQIWKNIGKIAGKCFSEKASELTKWINDHGLFHQMKEKIKNKISSAWETIKEKVG